MLTLKTLKSFAILEIIIERDVETQRANAAGKIAEHSPLTTTPRFLVEWINGQAEQRAMQYLAQQDPNTLDAEDATPQSPAERYADLCTYIKGVIEVAFTRKMVGVGKMTLLKELAEEDPAQFKTMLEQHELAEQQEREI